MTSYAAQRAEPLPDDRFTLTVSDAVRDLEGNALDGETNAVQPTFPSGDNVPGGDFVARFSVDSRPELGTYGAGQVFIRPEPGKGFDDEGGALDLEVSDYGTSVSSFGWEAELGVAGEVWGPFGYSLRFRLSRYQDTFSGAGTRTGWEAGGVAEETYSSLHWGITASY